MLYIDHNVISCWNKSRVLACVQQLDLPSVHSLGKEQATRLCLGKWLMLLNRHGHSTLIWQRMQPDISDSKVLSVRGPTCTVCGAGVHGAPSVPASPAGGGPDLAQGGPGKGRALQALSCPALLCPAQAC